MIIGRFILGIGVGLNVVVITVVIKETSPREISGLTGSMF